MKKILLLAAAAAALLMTAACEKPGRDDVTIDEGFVWAAANAGAHDASSLGFERPLKLRPLTPPKGYHVPSEAEWQRLYESCTWALESNGRVILAMGTSKTTGERIRIPLEKDQYDVSPGGSYIFDETYVRDGGSDDYWVISWHFYVDTGHSRVDRASTYGKSLCMIRYVKD